jgi:hypothetical protein
MANYRVDVYDTNKVRQAILTDFINLSYSKTVNFPGVISITLSGAHPLLKTIGDKWIVEIWRKETDTWQLEISGLFRDLNWEYSDNSIATINCYGILSVLGWRVIAWYADTTDRTKFISKKAETIAKTLVNYNTTSLASTANGRLRDGILNYPTISVQADSGTGNTLDYFCAYSNLLEALQDLSNIGGGDFDLVKQSVGSYQFQWFNGQRGSNKSSTLIFAINYGNMAEPTYNIERSSATSVAIVGGQGEANLRQIVVVNSNDYNVTTNNIETFVAATDVDTTNGLTSRGNSTLLELSPQSLFGFKVLQTPSCRYGIEYSLGDLVSVINPFTTDKYTVKIDGVQVSLSDNGNEQIDISMKMVG